MRIFLVDHDGADRGVMLARLLFVRRCAKMLVREIEEETAMTVEPVAFAGHREVLVRDDDRRVSRHFVILSFATRWISGEPKLNEELAEARWLKPEELADLKTTEGLAEIVAAAFERMAAAG